MARWWLALTLTACVGEATIDTDGASNPDDTAAAVDDSGDVVGDSAGDSGDPVGDSGDTTGDSGDTAGDSGDTAGDSGDTAPPPPCLARVVGTVTPANGARGVELNTWFTASFNSDQRRKVAFSVLDVATGVSTRLGGPAFSSSGLTGTSQPAAPLKSDHDYRFVVEFSCGTVQEFAFRTRTVGPPVVEDAVLDRTYAVDMGMGTVVQPVGLGGVLTPFLDQGNRSMMLRVTDYRATTFDFELGSALFNGRSWTQDRCESTVAIDNVNLTANPSFVVSVGNLPFVFGGTVVELQSAKLSGIFVDGGNGLEDVSISGAFDTRPLVSLLNLQGGPSAACLLLAQYAGGALCTACPDRSGSYCVPMAVANIPADDAAPFVLEPRTPGQVAADPRCGP